MPACCSRPPTLRHAAGCAIPKLGRRVESQLHGRLRVAVWRSAATAQARESGDVPHAGRKLQRGVPGGRIASMTQATTATPRPLTPVETLIPIVSLIALVGLSFFLFGGAGALGPNQVALVVATIIAVFMGWRCGHTLESMQEAAIASVPSGHRRDVHPPRGRFADRHLGDERHADCDGLLRAASAPPELLPPDRSGDAHRNF